MKNKMRARETEKIDDRLVMIDYWVELGSIVAPAEANSLASDVPCEGTGGIRSVISENEPNLEAMVTRSITEGYVTFARISPVKTKPIARVRPEPGKHEIRSSKPETNPKFE